jgi:hypothetical protein
MAATALDLYRMGNAAGARLDHVRPGRDVHVFERDGAEWVEGRSGGVSTFSRMGVQPAIWWRLPVGSSFDEVRLVLWNDHGQHWSWEPARDMPLSEYREALATANAQFVRA